MDSCIKRPITRVVRFVLLIQPSWRSSVLPPTRHLHQCHSVHIAVLRWQLSISTKPQAHSKPSAASAASFRCMNLRFHCDFHLRGRGRFDDSVGCINNHYLRFRWRGFRCTKRPHCIITPSFVRERLHVNFGCLDSIESSTWAKDDFSDRSEWSRIFVWAEPSRWIYNGGIGILVQHLYSHLAKPIIMLLYNFFNITTSDRMKMHALTR